MPNIIELGVSLSSTELRAGVEKAKRDLRGLEGEAKKAAAATRSILAIERLRLGIEAFALLTRGVKGYVDFLRKSEGPQNRLVQSADRLAMAWKGVGTTIANVTSNSRLLQGVFNTLNETVQFWTSGEGFNKAFAQGAIARNRAQQAQAAAQGNVLINGRWQKVKSSLSIPNASFFQRMQDIQQFYRAQFPYAPNVATAALAGGVGAPGRFGGVGVGGKVADTTGINALFRAISPDLAKPGENFQLDRSRIHHTGDAVKNLNEKLEKLGEISMRGKEAMSQLGAAIIGNLGTALGIALGGGGGKGFFGSLFGGLGSLASFIPGVGPLAAGAIGVGGGLISQLIQGRSERAHVIVDDFGPAAVAKQERPFRVTNVILSSLTNPADIAAALRRANNRSVPSLFGAT